VGFPVAVGDPQFRPGALGFKVREWPGSKTPP
jgi:hypothetical protein